MGFDPMTWMAIFAGTSAVAGIGTMIGGKPNMPAPPPPASYYSYDEDGIETIQVWDEKKNAYVTKRDPEPEFEVAKPEKRTDRQWVEEGDGGYYKDAEESDEQYNSRLKEWEGKRDAWRTESEDWQVWNKRKTEREQEKATRTGIRTKMLDNLNKAPEDRVQAYEEYAKNFSHSMQKQVDEQFGKAQSGMAESMSARGMTGSRADVDLQAELAKDKTESDIDIAAKAGMAKEQLAQADKDFWLRTIAELDAGGRSDAALALQQAQLAQQGAMQGTSSLMGRYAAEQQNATQKWQNKMQTGQSLLGTSAGLAYLYGYGKGGSGFLNPSVSRSGGLSNVSGYTAPSLNYNRPSWL